MVLDAQSPPKRAMLGLVPAKRSRWFYAHNTAATLHCKVFSLTLHRRDTTRQIEVSQRELSV